MIIELCSAGCKISATTVGSRNQKGFASQQGEGSGTGSLEEEAGGTGARLKKRLAKPFFGFPI